MNINIIDTVNRFAELRLEKHEILTICHALSKMKESLTEEDKWLLTEINGINDILKDGNFSRFLSFERGKWKQEWSKTMTQKQRHYIEFIQEWSGVPYHEGDNISDYINANQDKAQHEWELECLARGSEHEDAGDRD